MSPRRRSFVVPGMRKMIRASKTGKRQVEAKESVTFLIFESLRDESVINRPLPRRESMKGRDENHDSFAEETGVQMKTVNSRGPPT